MRAEPEGIIANSSTSTIKSKFLVRSWSWAESMQEFDQSIQLFMTVDFPAKNGQFPHPFFPPMINGMRRGSDIFTNVAIQCLEIASLSQSCQRLDSPRSFLNQNDFFLSAHLLIDFHAPHFLISTFITLSWLELKQPVELMKSVFVDAYLTHRRPSTMMWREY